MKKTCWDSAVTKHYHIEGENEEDYLEFFKGTPFELEYNVLRSILTKKLSKRNLPDTRHIY